MSWSVVNFGKYKGKTLPQIVFSDPDWFFWAYENNVFKGKGSVESEAMEVYKNARSIRIPNNAAGNLEAEYVIHPSVGKFAGMDIVQTTQPVHQGSSPAFRRKVIDLGISRDIGEYDKLGGKTLIAAAKSALFGSRSARMTQKRCEDFFDDPSNFV